MLLKDSWLSWWLVKNQQFSQRKLASKGFSVALGLSMNLCSPGLSSRELQLLQKGNTRRGVKTGEKPDGVTGIGEHPALASLLGPLYGTRSAPQYRGKSKDTSIWAERYQCLCALAAAPASLRSMAAVLGCSCVNMPYHLGWCVCACVCVHVCVWPCST